MSKLNSPRVETLLAPVFSNEEIARLLRSAVRDFHEAIRILDSSRQTETAGRLHALSVELRQLASDTEMSVPDDGLLETKQSGYLQ